MFSEADSRLEHARAADFLRSHVRQHFPGMLAGDDLVGYFALVHVGFRLTGVHPIYPPPGCWWECAFYGSEPE